MLLRHRYKGGLFLLDETHLPWGSNSAIHRGDEYPEIGAYGPVWIQVRILGEGMLHGIS